MTEQQLCETPYRSPQLPLWDSRADDWLMVIRLLPYASRRRSPLLSIPLSLPLPDQGHVASG